MAVRSGGRSVIFNSLDYSDANDETQCSKLWKTWIIGRKVQLSYIRDASFDATIMPWFPEQNSWCWAWSDEFKLFCTSCEWWRLQPPFTPLKRHHLTHRTHVHGGQWQHCMVAWVSGAEAKLMPTDQALKRKQCSEWQNEEWTLTLSSQNNTV